MPTIHFTTDAATAAFSHIEMEADVEFRPDIGGSAYVYIYLMRAKDLATVCTGFRSTAEMLSWLDAIDHTKHKEWSFYISGAFDVDDDGELYCFDGSEIHAGTTWDMFKQDHAAAMKSDEAERGEWRREVARQEGMLNGISSYNDWDQ